jgi:urocanate hydratase
MISNQTISEAMTIKLPEVLPDMPVFQEGIRRAPDRGFRLSEAQTKLALKNALRYVPEKFHDQVIPEFLEE